MSSELDKVWEKLEEAKTYTRRQYGADYNVRFYVFENGDSTEFDIGGCFGNMMGGNPFYRRYSDNPDKRLEPKQLKDNPAKYFATYCMKWHPNRNFIMARGSNPEKVNLEYIDWVANKSMFAPTFVNHDPEELLNRGMILNCKFPLRFALQGVIAIRHVVEYPRIISMWNEMKDHVDPHAAYILAHFLTRVTNTHGSKAHANTYGNNFIDGGNCAFFSSNFGQEAFTRFYRQDMSLMQDLLPMSQRPHSYGRFYKSWEKHENKTKNPMVFSGGTVQQTYQDDWGKPVEVKQWSIEDIAEDAPRFVKENTFVKKN